MLSGTLVSYDAVESGSHGAAWRRLEGEARTKPCRVGPRAPVADASAIIAPQAREGGQANNEAIQLIVGHDWHMRVVLAASKRADPPGTDGLIDAYANDLTQLILDISGYFAP